MRRHPRNHRHRETKNRQICIRNAKCIRCGGWVGRRAAHRRRSLCPARVWSLSASSRRTPLNETRRRASERRIMNSFCASERSLMMTRIVWICSWRLLLSLLAPYWTVASSTPTTHGRIQALTGMTSQYALATTCDWNILVELSAIAQFWWINRRLKSSSGSC